MEHTTGAVANMMIGADEKNDNRHIQDDSFLTLKRTIQKFQSDRLNVTYSDLKTNPEYTKIGDFFFNKLYGPEDFSFRDTGIRKLHKLIDGKVYKGIITAISQVIEFHELSDDLDNRMAEQMTADGVGPDLTADQYRSLYCRLDNYDERIRQIRLSVQVTKTFHSLSKKWIVGVSLKTVKSAAQIFGLGELTDFIAEGYRAFREISNIDYFAETIEKRETEWNNYLWGKTVNE